MSSDCSQIPKITPSRGKSIDLVQKKFDKRVPRGNWDASAQLKSISRGRGQALTLSTTVSTPTAAFRTFIDHEIELQPNCHGAGGSGGKARLRRTPSSHLIPHDAGELYNSDYTSTTPHKGTRRLGKGCLQYRDNQGTFLRSAEKEKASAYARTWSSRRIAQENPTSFASLSHVCTNRVK